MDYNNFCYYRANPYSNIDSLPPLAHQNRFKSNFIANLPQGDNHFLTNGRKHYRERSNIDELSILNHSATLNPHKPKNFETTDIEGAISSPLINPTLKNKSIAEAEIIKQQKQSNKYQDIRKSKILEEENLNRFHHDQYSKNKQMFNLISGRYVVDQSPKHHMRRKETLEYPNERTYFERQLSQTKNYQSVDFDAREKRTQRMQNPTNLTSDNSIFLAGKNIMNQ